MPDSFTTRGIDNTCSGEPAPRVEDAYGALAYLARQPFVDAGRIALLGFSAGGIATLSVVAERDFALFEGEAEHRLAIAFYPYCRSDNTFAIPTLILIGEADDWTPAAACRRMMADRQGGAPGQARRLPQRSSRFQFTLVAAGANDLRHRIEYNAAAAASAEEEVKQFLAAQLAR